MQRGQAGRTIAGGAGLASPSMNRSTAGDGASAPAPVSRSGSAAMPRPAALAGRPGRSPADRRRDGFGLRARGRGRSTSSSELRQRIAVRVRAVLAAGLARAGPRRPTRRCSPQPAQAPGLFAGTGAAPVLAPALHEVTRRPAAPAHQGGEIPAAPAARSASSSSPPPGTPADRPVRSTDGSSVQRLGQAPPLGPAAADRSTIPADPVGASARSTAVTRRTMTARPDRRVTSSPDGGHRPAGRDPGPLWPQVPDARPRHRRPSSSWPARRRRRVR